MTTFDPIPLKLDEPRTVAKIGEFFHLDENIWHGYGLRQAAIIPFALGLSVLAYYYLVLYRKKENEYESVAESVQEISSSPKD